MALEVYFCYHLPDQSYMSILIPVLNAYICNDDFLLAHMPPDSEICTACRGQSTISQDELIVVWWLTRAELSSRGILQHPPLFL